LVVAVVSLALLLDFTPADLGAQDSDGAERSSVARVFRGVTPISLALLLLLGLVAGVLEPRGMPETRVLIAALLITAAAAAPLLAWSIGDMLIPGGEEHNLFPIEWSWYLFYGSSCGVGFVLSAGLGRVLLAGQAPTPSEVSWVTKGLTLAAIAAVGIGARLLLRPWLLPVAALAAGAMLGRRIPAGRLLLLAAVVGVTGVVPPALHWGSGVLARGQGMDWEVLYGWIYHVVWAAISSACFGTAAWLARASIRGRVAAA
jgi:hypothetical protein